GSVLVEIETEGEDAAAAPAKSRDERPIADGSESPTEQQEAAIPVMAVEEVPSAAAQAKKAPAVADVPASGGGEPAVGELAKVLASPAVRQRARDLGIDLSKVRSSGERIRHADLDSYLLYNGGSVTGRGAAMVPDETVKVVGLRRRIAENMQEAKRRIPHF